MLTRKFKNKNINTFCSDQNQKKKKLIVTNPSTTQDLNYKTASSMALTQPNKPEINSRANIDCESVNTNTRMSTNFSIDNKQIFNPSQEEKKQQFLSLFSELSNEIAEYRLQNDNDIQTNDIVRDKMKSMDQDNETQTKKSQVYHGAQILDKQFKKGQLLSKNYEENNKYNVNIMKANKNGMNGKKIKMYRPKI